MATRCSAIEGMTSLTVATTRTFSPSSNRSVLLRSPPAGGPTALPNGDAPEEQQKGAFTPKLFGPYFAGNKFGAIALGMRAEGDEAKTLAREHRDMAQSMLNAWASLNS